MKKLCLGTFLRILSFSRIDNTKQYTLFASLLKTVKTDEVFSDDKFQAGLKSGKNNLTNFEEILTIDKNELIKHFYETVTPYFDLSGQKLVITCIRDVLNDDDIGGETIIGFETEGYSKQEIVGMQVFPFSEFLANVFYYVTTAIKNIPYKDNIKEISKTYIESQKSFISNIQIETKVSKVYSKVKLTLDPEPFGDVFTEIKQIDIGLTNPNQLSIYSLDVTNNRLNYDAIQNFIANNICRYIYSRAMRNNFKVCKDRDALVVKALRAYNKRVKTDKTTNHFNELMLYSFLECVLGAPKIFSKMELQDNSGKYESTASGIHILTIKKNTVPFNQLVYGAADTFDSLSDAIDNALAQVTKINSSDADEFEFLETTILNGEFDANTNKALEDMILPKKDSNYIKPDSAYGLFIGYTVNIENESNNNEFRNKLKEQMKIDIDLIAPYIKSRINELNLNGYSFYIYVLPLNNALIDKDEIMKNALEVGE